MPVLSLVVALLLALAGPAAAGDAKPAAAPTTPKATATPSSSETCACAARKAAFMDRKLRERAAAEAEKKTEVEPGS